MDYFENRMIDTTIAEVSIPLTTDALLLLGYHSDGICRQYCKNIDFLEQQLTLLPEKTNHNAYKRWNICAVGNFAWLAFYSPEKYKENFKEMLESFIDWKKNGGTVKFEGI
jgi:hypothetical protein